MHGQRQQGADQQERALQGGKPEGGNPFGTAIADMNDLEEDHQQEQAIVTLGLGSTTDLDHPDEGGKADARLIGLKGQGDILDAVGHEIEPQ